MCGRYTLTKFSDELAEQVGLNETSGIVPRYNIAPGQMIISVLADDETRKIGVRVLEWGLVPHWTRDLTTCRRAINARAETIAEKSSFKTAFRYRRCLIPADGFFEWQKKGARKQPFYFQRSDERPFAFAGLWEHWEGSNGHMIDSCVIITTKPNALVRRIHDRMPVILGSSDYKLWLDPLVQSGSDVSQLLIPFAAEEMKALPVGQRVNDCSNDDAECIVPLAGNDYSSDDHSFIQQDLC